MPGASAKQHLYVHPAIGDEIRAIGGGYSTVRESIIRVGGREVLYSIVVARLDSSCCGEGGCAYANVIGYPAGEETTDPSGRRTRLVEAIDDAGARERATRAVRERENVYEVRFWSPEP